MPLNISHQKFVQELASLSGLSSGQAKKLSGSSITGKLSYGQIKDSQALKKHVTEFLDNAQKQGVKLPGGLTGQNLEKHLRRINSQAAPNSAEKPSTKGGGFLGGVRAIFGAGPKLARKNFSAVEYLKKVHGQNASPEKGQGDKNTAVTSASALTKKDSEPRAPDIG